MICDFVHKHSKYFITDSLPNSFSLVYMCVKHKYMHKISLLSLKISQTSKLYMYVNRKWSYTNNNTSGAVKKSKLPLLHSAVCNMIPSTPLKSWVELSVCAIYWEKIKYLFETKYWNIPFIYLFGICNICSIIWLMTTFSLLTWNTIYSHTQDTQL